MNTLTLNYRVVPRGSVRVIIPVGILGHFSLSAGLPLNYVQDREYHVFYEAPWHPLPEKSFIWQDGQLKEVLDATCR